MRKAKDGYGSMADIVCGKGGFCVNFDLFFFFFFFGHLLDSDFAISLI